MAIPLAYNLRNLRVRKMTTLMTALGVALTVSVLLGVMALVEGLGRAFRSSGDPLNIIVTRKGASVEMFSMLARSVFQDLKFKPGVARGPDGAPLASIELVTVINLPSVDNPDGTNVNVRGVGPAGLAIRKNLVLERGRWFGAGQRELVVGGAIASRYPATRLGAKLRFGRGYWEIVGVVRAGESAQNSELFGDVNLISADYNRADLLSSALLRATDEVAAAALINVLSSDQKLNVDAISERGYYDAQTSSAKPVQVMGTFIAAIMAIGSSFAAMNTMYAAVARRSREIGTLRVLGFSKGGILVSFLIESLLLAVLGGMIGCLMVLPLNNLTSGIGSFTTFSETTFQFRVTPGILTIGLTFALFMGAIGGFFPAASAARKEILVALRAV